MKLGILFFGSIFERTGAGKVVKAFDENKMAFERRCHTASLYTNESNTHSTNKSHHGLFMSKIKRKIMSSIAHLPIGAFKLIDILYFKKGENVVNKYWDNIQYDDVLIFHEIFTCYAYVKKCRSQGNKIKPYILILHTNGEVFKMLKIYYPNITNSKYLRILEERAEICMQQALKIVLVARTALEHFQTVYPQFKDKSDIVYNGINEDTCDKDPIFDGTIRMVSVGTVNARKNQILQVRALSKILETQDATLTIVGDGDKLNECKLLAKELGIENKIVFRGASDEIPSILQKNNVYVMTSLDEGLPISIIEALRAKLPIIVTDVGGNKELISDNGWLIKPNKEEFIRAVLSFGKSIENQKEMSASSYILFKKHFTINNMLNNYCDIIESISTES